jgi:hypothetical protein
MSAPDLEVRCALLLCEFKSSGSAEVIHECRGDILATRKSAPGTFETSCNVPSVVASGWKADVGRTAQFGRDRPDLHRAGTPRCEFRGAHLPRHRTGGIADRRTDPLQIRHQLEDGQSNRTDDPAICLGPRRRGDRIALQFAAVHESPSGTKRTSRDVRSSVADGGKADMAVTSVDFRVWTLLGHGASRPWPFML